MTNGGNAPYTISLWVNFNVLTGNQELLREWEPSYRYRCYTTNDTLTFRFMAGNSKAIDLSTSVNSNSWYFVTGIYTGSQVKLYINNTLIDSSTMSSGATGSGHNLIIGSEGSQNWMNGKIDDIRIYNRALSETEVKRLYWGGELATSGVTSCPPASTTGSSITINSDLSFTIPSATYNPVIGNPMNLELNFKHNGNGLLWELDSYTVK